MSQKQLYILSKPFFRQSITERHCKFCLQDQRKVKMTLVKRRLLMKRVTKQMNMALVTLRLSMKRVIKQLPSCVARWRWKRMFDE